MVIHWKRKSEKGIRQASYWILAEGPRGKISIPVIVLMIRIDNHPLFVKITEELHGEHKSFWKPLFL